MDLMTYDFEGMISNLQYGRLRFLGAGSSRRVYEIEDGYAVKAAKNYRGLNQNRMEYMIYNNEKSKILAPVLAISEDARYLIMRKGERMPNFHPILQYYHCRNMWQLANQPMLQILWEKYMLAGGDLVRISSWGMVDRVPVLIDYGFSHMRLD